MVFKASRFYKQTRAHHGLELEKYIYTVLKKTNREETTPHSHYIWAGAYTRANTAAATSITQTELLAA